MDKNFMVYAEKMRAPDEIQTTQRRSKLMTSVRQSDTPIELAVRKLIHREGVRFRTQGKDLPGTPDIVNRSKKWAIFVHGCFWHAHNNCREATLPKRNQSFWQKKLAGNKERDERKIRDLQANGYRVLVVWGCEIQNELQLLTRLRDFFRWPTRAT